MTTFSIRTATLDDVPAMVELAQQRRVQHQNYQPRFWRNAVDSREKHAPFLRKLVQHERAISLVSEADDTVNGFVIATLVPAPPVYDVGGLTCSIDDFCVVDGLDWDHIGKALLDEVIERAKARGAVQTVVVCAHLDEVKRKMLADQGFTIASEWYVREI
jgi:GNAT superfamily N-acetyltransferase